MFPGRTHPIFPSQSNRRSRTVVLGTVLASTLILASCGHSTPATSGSTPAKTATTTSSASTDGPGVFGKLGRICSPGNGAPKPSNVRGVTDSAIQIGVLNDAGNSIVPSLGANYPKVAKAFAAWCNKAGGINGRKIVINDRNAKLFNAASAVVEACQHDFMLVGGGAALDAPTIQPRLKCKLGAIPTLTPSHEDQVAGLQAAIGRTSLTESNWGLFRLLEPEYTAAFQKIGILTLDSPDVKVAYVNFQKSLESQGLKVTSYQAVSQNLDNVRTYVQPLVGNADALILGYPAIQIYQAMADVGYQPKVVVDEGSIFYSLSAVNDLKKVPIKAPIYSAATTYPLDQTAQNPTAAKLVELEKAAFGKVDPADTVPWISWLLFAKSASSCGTLTVNCVIGKATADTAYTAGGLLAPTDMSDPTKLSKCIAVSTVSGAGIAYDRKLTQPDNGLFNCDAKNLIPIPQS